MSSVHLWLRAESKANEHRTALVPEVCKRLLNSGFKITVEKSSERIFPDSDYIGCTMVEAGSWKQAPSDAYIIGLKELPENDTSPLKHNHIFFAHCYKKQAGWKEILQRFNVGGGTILDLEFLNDEKGRRVAAFGYHAGFTGAAVGLDTWCYQINNSKSAVDFPPIKPYPNDDALKSHVKQQLELASKKLGRQPKVLVMGALGRCGSGACDFTKAVGIPDSNILKWDMAETAKGGPFVEIVEADIFVNCIYLSKPIPPFLTMDLIENPPNGITRNLSVIVDVSCDTTNPHNPIPLYTETTTFDHPVINVKLRSGKPLDVVAIDHLPTMLPREASIAFCNDLYDSLEQLKDKSKSRVWMDADRLFHQKVEEMKSS